MLSSDNAETMRGDHTRVIQLRRQFLPKPLRDLLQEILLGGRWAHNLLGAEEQYRNLRLCKSEDFVGVSFKQTAQTF